MKLNDIMLVESPQMIPNLPIEMDLNNYNINKSKFNELNKLQKNIYHKFDDKRIVYYTNNKYFCLDYDKNEVTYYMEYDTSFTTKTGSFLWQSLVWRSKKVTYNNALPREIFYNVLVPKYGTIATDGQQTSYGKQFWAHQIAAAFKHNLNVYYFDMRNKELIQINNMLHLDELTNSKHIWGESSTHKHQLILISKHVLPKS